MSEIELQVLKVLAPVWADEANCYFFWYIAKQTGLDKQVVRNACRRLKRKGYAEYVTGLIDDEGKLAGSGYACTEKGYQYVEKLPKETTTLL